MYETRLLLCVCRGTRSSNALVMMGYRTVIFTWYVRSSMPLALSTTLRRWDSWRREKKIKKKKRVCCTASADAAPPPNGRVPQTLLRTSAVCPGPGGSVAGRTYTNSSVSALATSENSSAGTTRSCVGEEEKHCVRLLGLLPRKARTECAISPYVAVFEGRENARGQ